MANERTCKRPSGWQRKRHKLAEAEIEMASLKDEIQDGAADRDQLLAEISSLRKQLATLQE